MVGANQFKAQQFIDAIADSGGIVSTIAKRVGCSWHTARRYIDEYPTITRAYYNEVESVADMAEGVVHGAMKAGDVPTSKWYLSTKAKHRGFGQEVSLAGVVELTVKYEEYDGNDEEATTDTV